MPGWLKFILEVIVFAIIILTVYNVLKKYVLSKVKANKWVILVIVLLVFTFPYTFYVVTKKQLTTAIINYVQMPVFVIFFLWFMDLIGFGATRNVNRKDDKDNIVIKPKAKPNRVKNNNCDKK